MQLQPRGAALREALMDTPTIEAVRARVPHAVAALEPLE